MDSPSLRTPAWYRALALTERLASLRTAAHTASPSSVDNDLADRRRRRWQAQPPFEAGTYLAERLALDGMTEEQWRRLLGESAEALCDRCPAPPTWLETVTQAFARPISCQASPFPVSEGPEADRMLGFLEVARPLLDDARDRLSRETRELSAAWPAPPFDSGTVADVLSANLPWQLTQMLSRTMILELNVARLQGQLPGDTAEKRFHSFLERLRQREVALALLQEYPVLARQLVTAIDHWVRFGVEFLRHLCADWEALLGTFSPEMDPGPLIEVREAGDAHRGGRSVLIATFATGFRVVYKPKSLAVDAHFQELLTWLNERGHEPPFRPLKILDRGTHGWVEFVEARGCASEGEVRRFYERQGGQLALLYALEATDLHSENLIAAGEHPILVDLEAIFHPLTPEAPLERLGRLESFFDRSVLRTGLLPERLWSGEGSEGIDISGLGAELEQQTPFGVPRWEGAGTDEMRVVFKRVTIPGGPNRPTLNGQVVEVSDYADAVAAGFTNVYRLLSQHRQALLAEGGPVTRFAGDEVRVILRPTTTYCVLMRESFHPDILRDALDRDRLFDRLWVKVEEIPCLAQVIRAEREEMWRGDIPVFTTRPDTRDLWTGSGERIVDFFDEPGMVLVRRRVENLSEADLAQQTWIIRASLATLAKSVGRTKRTARLPCNEGGVADRPRLLAAARAVGERLEALALHDSARVSWVGLTAIDERRCSLELLGPDLYDGLPGVVFFLAYLGATTGEERWTSLARAALATLTRQVKGRESRISSIGAFSGWGGVIYALTHLGVLWDEPSLLAEAQAAVELLPPLIEQDDQFDIISGAAGCVGGLVSLYRCAPSEQVHAAAKQCGDWLLAHAVPAEPGIGWPAVLPARGPLTGFSHGAAGGAWALFELAALTGEDRFGEAARAAVAYERSIFSPQKGNWPDLRDPDDPSQEQQDSFVTAWCHGAPGIGLARLSSLRHFDDPVARTEVEAAIRTTLKHGFGGNHSLCHGDLGNIELLLQASQVLDDPQYHSHVDRLATQILEDIRLDGWRCGVPQGVESPGLMTGLAGIGYGLLRLAEPTRAASLLTLAPPTKGSDHAR